MQVQIHLNKQEESFVSDAFLKNRDGCESITTWCLRGVMDKAEKTLGKKFDREVK